jgi:hypothetical protein
MKLKKFSYFYYYIFKQELLEQKLSTALEDCTPCKDLFQIRWKGSRSIKVERFRVKIRKK